jgi:hypothetical protein
LTLVAVQATVPLPVLATPCSHSSRRVRQSDRTELFSLNSLRHGEKVAYRIICEDADDLEPDCPEAIKNGSDKDRYYDGAPKALKHCSPATSPTT